MANREQRTFTSDVRELRRISAWWREWAGSRLDDNGSRRGELCLNEAVANIVQHGSLPAHPLTIEITLESAADSVQVTIADDGPPFNPLEHPSPDRGQLLMSARGGGLGIHLIRTNAAEMKYSRGDGRNVLILRFVADAALRREE